MLGEEEERGEHAGKVLGEEGGRREHAGKVLGPGERGKGSWKMKRGKKGFIAVEYA